MSGATNDSDSAIMSASGGTPPPREAGEGKLHPKSTARFAASSVSSASTPARRPPTALAITAPTRSFDPPLRITKRLFQFPEDGLPDLRNGRSRHRDLIFNIRLGFARLADRTPSKRPGGDRRLSTELFDLRVNRFRRRRSRRVKPRLRVPKRFRRSLHRRPRRLQPPLDVVAPRDHFHQRRACFSTISSFPFQKASPPPRKGSTARAPVTRGEFQSKRATILTPGAAPETLQSFGSARAGRPSNPTALGWPTRPYSGSKPDRVVGRRPDHRSPSIASAQAPASPSSCRAPRRMRRQK